MNISVRIEELRVEHYSSERMYFENVVRISEEPKVPLKPSKYDEKIYKPKVGLRVIYVIIIFLFLSFLTHQFPTMYVAEWLIDNLKINHDIWYIILYTIAVSVQGIFYYSEYKDYRHKLMNKEKITKKYNKELSEFESKLKEFRSKYISVEYLENKNRQLTKRMAEIQKEIENLEYEKAIEIIVSKSSKTVTTPKVIAPNKAHLLNHKAYPVKSYSNSLSSRDKTSVLIAKARQRLNKEVLDIENRTDLTDDKKVDRIITLFSTFCAAIAVQPIPFADVFILTPIQGYMGKKIADIRGYNITEAGSIEVFKEIAGLVGLGFLAQQLVIGAYKTVLPFLGAITTIPLVFGLSFGMGRVMDYYFEKKIKGENINTEELKKIFKLARVEGKNKAKENEDDINSVKEDL